MTVNTSKKLHCVHIWVNSQNSQLTDFDLYSYLPLKFSKSRRVNDVKTYICISTDRYSVNCTVCISL